MTDMNEIFELAPKMSNMMQHYLGIKKEHPDCLIFYRLGDFYEMFFKDAEEASEILELTLTGRDCGIKDFRAPMCGVPFHAVDPYIAKLVAKGKKVAICEQLTEPGAQKGLVERGVIRVVTTGTMTASELMDEKSNNFLCSVYCGTDGCALSWADITTGEFYCQEVDDGDKIADSLMRINPAQIICNENAYGIYLGYTEALRAILPRFERYKDQAFGFNTATNSIKQHFEVATITAFIDDDRKASVSASGALISYLRETQMHSLKNITGISCYDDGTVLTLDASAQRNLEITRSMRDGKPFGSLLWAVDYTKTAGGGRKIKEILTSPPRDISISNYRLDGVEDLFKDNHGREAISETMREVKDLERLCGRLSNNILNPKDCRAILQTLNAVPLIKFRLSGMPSKIIRDIYNNLGEFESLAKLIDAMIDENPPVTTANGGYIKEGFNEELDHYIRINRDARTIIKEIEARERESTGIKTLKVGYNKVFGYYIEVSNSFKDSVPETYIRKQTLVNGERFITEELKRFEEEVLTSGEKRLKLESALFNQLVLRLTENLSPMLKCAKCLSMLDVLLSFATVAKKRNYVRPVMLKAGSKLNIVGGRHPVVEAASKESFVPNDTLLDNDENRMAIITGPNMAGKSTYMRQVALITLLAHAGCFVPAKSAEIPLTDKIFTRVGASDNLIFDQSTFMVEMAEVATIIRNATPDSLLILDEVGRGTSTYDGLSIAWAVVEYLSSTVKAKTLFATHYHELTELQSSVDGVKNYKVNVKEINGKIIFLRKILEGSANKSFGIEVASLAGVPEAVTKRAKQILKLLEKNDLAKASAVTAKEDATDKQLSYVENYIKELDMNNVTPMKAFEILAFLKEKTDDEN